MYQRNSIKTHGQSLVEYALILVLVVLVVLALVYGPGLFVQSGLRHVTTGFPE